MSRRFGPPARCNLFLALLTAVAASALVACSAPALASPEAQEQAGNGTQTFWPGTGIYSPSAQRSAAHASPTGSASSTGQARPQAVPSARRRAIYAQPARPAGASAYGTASAPLPGRTTARPLYKLGGPLQGSVTVNVPKTPEDVAKYLAKMRVIIDRYDKVAVATLLSNGSPHVDPTRVGEARNQTIDMIQTIRAITPPAELKNRHYQLADTLAEVGDFMANPGQAEGGGLAALAQLGPMMQRLHSTIDGYHTGVRNCMAYYSLGPEHDPFAGESEEDKENVTSALQELQSGLANRPQAGASRSADQAPAAGLESLGGLLGGGGSLGDLQNLDLKQLGSSLGNIDLNSLGGLGNLGGTDLRSLGNQSGLSRLGSLDLNSLGQLTKGELDTLRPGDATAGASHSSNGGSPGLDPSMLGQFGKLLQQLQGQ